MNSSKSITSLTNELENILNVQEMTSRLMGEQRLIQKQVDGRYSEELTEKDNLDDKVSLLDRKFIYGNISLHNLHTWVNISKGIFILLSIIVIYLVIFRHGT